MSSQQRSRVRWPAWLFSSCLLSALAIACNALTGTPDLHFRAGECNMFTGAGCGAGQTCRFSREELGPACRPLSTTVVAPYATCQQDSECPGSYLCVGNLCRKYCESASDCGWANARCSAADGEVFSTCARFCDLVSPDAPRAGLQSCGTGARCNVVADAGGASYTDCFEATGTAAEDAECQVDSDCQAGLYCQSKHCKVACDMNHSTCGDGQKCGGFTAMAGQQVGSCCTLPAGQRCDLATDCGCGIGETCLVANGAPLCRTVLASPVAPYAGCTTERECPSRYSCVGASVTNLTSGQPTFAGVCSLRCNAAADCGSEGDLCEPVNASSGPGFSICVRGCDPISPQMPNAGFRACGPGATCGIYRYGNVVASNCGHAGAGVEGSPCDITPDCSPGFRCIGGACARWCEPGGKSCGDGFACGNTLRDTQGREFGSCCPLPTAGRQACDWVTDCGCALGQTCAGQSGALTVCRNVTAPAAAAYTACTADADCPRAHSCLAGTCMQHCATATDCSWPDAVCLPSIDSLIANVCSRSCDALAPSAPATGFQPCGPNLGCAAFSAPGGAQVFSCIRPGAVMQGASCSSDAECAAGLVCAGRDAQSLACVPYCDLATSSCASGTVCTAIDPALPVVAGRALGACVPSGAAATAPAP